MSMPETHDATSQPLELSVVMPCLNEIETIEACIKKAQAAFTQMGIAAEVLIADNGSTDGSQGLARQLGARVVDIAQKGYGAALAGGIHAARGKFVIMGDSDDSYDFSAIAPFVQLLREGNDLVMGCRLPWGGGTIMPGAMPLKHLYLGNPVLSFIGQMFFKSPVTDFHCGLRGFSKEAFMRMDLRTTGMEFASEMVIKATLHNMRIAQVPITLHKDGRTRPPHLRSWRDGWRHLRFMLLFAPAWLFLLPAAVLGALGLGGFVALATGPLELGPARLDTNTLLVAAMCALLSVQLTVFYFFTKTFSLTEGLIPSDKGLHKLFSVFTLEVGLVVGTVVLAIGAWLLGAQVMAWRSAGYGDLSYPVTLRKVIPAVTLIVIGAQVVFSSFFMSVLGLRRR